MVQTKQHESDQPQQEKGAVVRSDPARRLFDWLGWPSWASRLESMDFFDEHMIRVEELQEGEAYVVRAEAPGLDPDKDVDVQVSDHTLHIEARRSEQQESKDKGQYRSEFRYGRFVRNIPLPAGADGADVKATYKDGILEVRVPVSATRAQGMKVPVQRT